MKLCRRSILLAVLAAFVCYAEPPQNLSVEYQYWTSKPFGSNTSPYLTHPGTAQEGVWAAVWVDDPEIEALSITLNYCPADGRELNRTELIPRWYRDRAGWTNVLFIVGNVKVKSILVTPLKAATYTKLIKIEE